MQEPTEGDTRVVMEFLLFPLTIAGKTKWLCKAAWRERFDGYDCDPSIMRQWQVWEPVEWLSVDR